MTSPLHGEGRRFEFGRAHRLFFQSGARIEPQTDDGEYEELHNSDEKLCNFGLAESVESLAKIMTDRYIDEEGNEQIEMLWDELIPEEVVEWDEKNDPYMLKAEAKLRKALKQQREVEEEEAKDAQAQRNLSFAKDELDQYVTDRTKGLRKKSHYWIIRSAAALWVCTQGQISREL